MQECLTFTGADRDTELRRDLKLIKDFFWFQTNIAMPKIILFSDQFYTNTEEKRWDMILI